MLIRFFGDRYIYMVFVGIGLRELVNKIFYVRFFRVDNFIFSLFYIDMCVL